MLDWTSLIVFACFIEILTIIIRYGLNLSAKIHYEKFLRRFGWKKVVHIHHMYFGVILAVYSYMNVLPGWFNLGLGLIVSDLFHHFFVLKLVEGDSEFKLVHRI